MSGNHKVMNQRQKQFFEAQKLHSMGDANGALRIYERLKDELKGSTLFTYWSLALIQLGRESEAKVRALSALEELPSEGAVGDRVVLSTVLRRLGYLNDAERILREALASDPNNAAARNNLALVLMQIPKYEEADKLFAQAQEELVEDAAPSLNRMRIALVRRDFDHAEAMLAVARDAQPGHADIPLLEARLALLEVDHVRAAEAIFKTLVKQPLHQEALAVLSAIDVAAIPFDKLERLLAAVVRNKPTSAKMLGMIVGLARKNLAWSHLSALESMLNSALENNQDALIEVGAMFLLLSSNISQKAHRVASHNGFEAFIARGRNNPRPNPRPLIGRKLRVGYISSDLRGHAIGYLSVGVFEAHKHDDIEYIAYANWKDDGSEVRRRMRKAFDRFVNITELSDEDIAKRMREDGIDVLVDLNQMTAGNRLGVFSYGPAPVTVQWLGMPGTVGAGDRIDYVVMDPWTAYPGNLDGFDESPVIIAGSYQPNDWEKPDLSLGKTRADWGLPEEAPVFCSFNQTQKFSPDTIALWERILAELPDSVLWVLAGDPALEERFTNIFAEAGIKKERIIFAPKASHKEHIARLKHADIMLDNWPYNAHTTCSDSLRAGTPVLTLPGRTFASRVAAGILDAAGLDDWIAISQNDYVSKAVEWGRKSFSLRQSQKQEIYDRYWSSPMVDCTGFARRLEAFYKAAFQRALEEKAPTPMWLGWGASVNEGLPDPNLWRETIHANRPDGRQSKVLESSNEQSQLVAESADNSVSMSSSWQERLSFGKSKSRFHNLKILFNDVLKISKSPLFIDAGSLPQELKLWDQLADQKLIDILAFDPQLKEEISLNRKVSNIALGDGNDHELRICEAKRMSSLLEPNQEWLRSFSMFQEWAKVLDRQKLSTSRLDDIPEASGVRFIKIDTQGFEQTIIENAQKLMANDLAMIELELSPVPFYEGEKNLFEVGQWLMNQGWILHTFISFDKRKFNSIGLKEDSYSSFKHVVQVDAVFMPHPERWKTFTRERLLDLAFVAHAIYGSYDVAALALQTMQEVYGESPLSSYRRYLEIASVDA